MDDKTLLVVNNEQMPTDNNGWFMRLVTNQLGELSSRMEDMKRELRQGQLDSIARQNEMHQANQARMESMAKTMESHVAEDRTAFETLRLNVQELQPAKKLVYGLIALVLVAFMTAIIASVIPRPTQMQQPGQYNNQQQYTIPEPTRQTQPPQQK